MVIRTSQVSFVAIPIKAKGLLSDIDNLFFVRTVAQTNKDAQVKWLAGCSISEVHYFFKDAG